MKSLNYLNKYFVKYAFLLVSGVIFIILNNYFLAKMPVIIGEATELLTGKKASSFNVDFIYWAVITLILWYFAFSLIKGFFLFLTRQTIIIMSRRIEFDLKNEIYKKYQELDYMHYKSSSTGDLMNRISEDVSKVRMYLGPSIMYAVNLLFSFPFLCYQMFNLSPKLSIYALAPLPIMAVIIYFVTSKMSLMSKRVQEKQAELSVISQETFSGIRVIKAYLQEKHIFNRFSKASQEYHDRVMAKVKVNAIFMPTITLLIGMSTLLCVYIGGMESINGTLAPSVIITFILCINQLTWPFASIGWVTTMIQEAAASQERINQFLKITPKIKNTNFDTHEEFQVLEFKNVDFSYNDHNVVLKNISFKLEKGKSIGIIGRTGVGKSTVLRLITRQIEVSKGQILINDKPIEKINLDAFREYTSIVPQDVFLFSDTIENNIRFGGKKDQEISKTDLEKVSKDAHVLHNILDFPEKFDTILGERGINLSGGQKQRVSIARALIRKPQILLLDDCLSAVDTETEDIILNNLKRYVQEYNTASIIVSHRVSSLRNVDEILVLEEGEIVERGSHDQLLQVNGIYTEMYNKQLSETKE